MADATWVGGVHRINDPASWIPGLPGPGDTGFIGQNDFTQESNVALAIGETIGPYSLVSDGRINAYRSTITASISNSGNPNVLRAIIDLTGSNTVTGKITDIGDYNQGEGLQIDVNDVKAYSGTTVQQGILINDGALHWQVG